jgi:hypothetical protein
VWNTGITVGAGDVVDSRVKIINDALLASYRTSGPCRWCGRHVRMRCAAHIFSRGAGRVDIPSNLVALGMDALRDCDCHHRSHQGERPIFEDLLAVSAADNDCLQGSISDLVYLVRRLDKSTTKETFLRACESLNDDARSLAFRQLPSFEDLLYQTDRKSKVCAFEECGRPSRSWGLCQGHSAQKLRGQNLRPIYATSRHRGAPPVIAFEIEPCTDWGISNGLRTPCHVFKGRIDRGGYGRVSIGKVNAYAHRYVWERVHGPIAGELMIDHMCRRRCCVNVDHLRLVDHKTNSTENVVGVAWQLMAAKTHCKYGHPYDEANTRINTNGSRSCRQCDKMYNARAREKRQRR